VTHTGSLQWTDRKKFEFLIIQVGGGRHLENHKNRDISAMVWPIVTEFDMKMQNGSLTRSDRLKNLILKIRDDGRPPF